MNTTISMTFRSLLCAVVGIALATTAVAQPPIDRDPAGMMKRADTDGDGTVSRDEFMKAQAARLEAMFSRMDTNGDGKLSPEEFAEARARMREHAPRNGRSPAGPGRLAREGHRGPEEGFRKPPQQD